MTRRAVSPFDLLHAALLRAASLLVPAAERAEWLQEWRGELWHVREAFATGIGSPSGRREREVTAFCLGAFQDALCVCRADRDTTPAGQGTPLQCLFVLGALLAGCYGLALLLPGVRAERTLLPCQAGSSLIDTHPGSSDLVQIRLAAASGGDEPTISARSFRSWQGQRQRFFDGMAFYRVEAETIQPVLGAPGNVDHPTWQVAHVSPSLFKLLGVATEFPDTAPSSSSLPIVLLSERTWKREFGADPHVSGRTIRLVQRNVRIAGVFAGASLGLPEGVDAWQIDPAAASGSGFGFVVARLRPEAKLLMDARLIHISSDDREYENEDLLGVALGQDQPSDQRVYLFAMLLALLALPAITTVSLGEASTQPHRASWARRILGWSFFTAKAALLLPVIYFASMDLAFGWASLYREQSIYIQLAAAFGMCLFSMRWVLKDQRQRCPVCMRLVTHPAQVGQASRTFLDWNGTEMMCMGGHTLLHVPSLPTSWFGAQRWLYLDTSWNFLFAGSTRPTP